MPQVSKSRMVDPSGRIQAQLLDSLLGLGALGVTIGTVFSAAGIALLLLLLFSFLAFDLLHGPSGPTPLRHRLLPMGQSQGAGEGPGRQAAPLFPTGIVSGLLSLQDALLLLFLGLGLFLGGSGIPLALLGLAFCLHPWD
ncbi:uncharacterized protein C20orf141 homolog isoform X1 [Peromyscus maniculatus bairdii]|uniref:uncharacterized protein C20orf141 homolog isoform X1 n=1 Tax=Peromyscus maniculatus bairdii TaxID=230844 RepID=UPI001C2E4E6B|nr:uncharacterized protein C20orf141 homolog isoform X1 [Peromyscus maniculatus bairdii]